MFCFELIKKIIFHLTFLTFYKEVLLDLVRCINHHAARDRIHNTYVFIIPTM